MEAPLDEITQDKQRHGCVTTWIILMIILNAGMSITYLFASDVIESTIPNASPLLITLLGIIGLVHVLFAIMLWKWKKVGFYGFIITSIITVGINIAMDLGVGQSVTGLIGVAILYGILQIKKGDKSAWENME